MTGRGWRKTTWSTWKSPTTTTMKTVNLLATTNIVGCWTPLSRLVYQTLMTTILRGEESCSPRDQRFGVLFVLFTIRLALNITGFCTFFLCEWGCNLVQRLHYGFLRILHEFQLNEITFTTIYDKFYDKDTNLSIDIHNMFELFTFNFSCHIFCLDGRWMGFGRQ